MTTVIRDMLGPHKPKTVRGVDARVIVTNDGDRFIFDGERLLDKVTCHYYVPERRLIERVNKNLERAARLAEESAADHAAMCIRALKESA